jgi:predicted RND superfamily exporter protein
MTGLTTAGSLLSFLSATLQLIADFGISAPVGVMLSLVLSLVLLPALIAVTPMRVRPVRSSALRRLPVACGALGVRRPLTVILVWAALFAVSLASASQIRISNYALDWFEPDVPFRVATELIDRELGGASSIEIVIDSGRENGLYEPELLRRIDALQHHAEGHPFGTGHVKRATVSIVEVVKEIHQALNGNEPGSSGTDDLEDIVDSQFRIGRVSLPIPFTDSILSVPILEEFERDLPKILGDQAGLQITGQFSIGAKTVSATVNSMARTYAVAFTVITPFMMLLLGSVRTGLLSMAPAIGAILISLGVMGVFDMPLDGFILLVGSIALGLAVDDTIHFMHNYARARARGQDVDSTVRTTLESTGQALFFTSLVLIAGFLAYTQATLNLLINFGILTALAIGIAFAANVTPAPALVTLVARLRKDGESPQSVVPKSLPGRSSARGRSVRTRTC